LNLDIYRFSSPLSREHAWARAGSKGARRVKLHRGRRKSGVKVTMTKGKKRFKIINYGKREK